MIDRYCSECGQRIIGRSDKKFCNDQCRTAWHNRLKTERRKSVVAPVHISVTTSAVSVYRMEYIY